MTSDEIMSLAREAGFSVRGETIRTMHSSGAWVGINNELAKFAELVTSEELRRLHAENEALRAKMALVDYVLQDDIHNRLTPRVVDIAYSAFMIAKPGKNKDDGGPCDWFNDTKPMVMEQLAKIQKHLVEEAAHGIKP